MTRRPASTSPSDEARIDWLLTFLRRDDLYGVTRDPAQRRVLAEELQRYLAIELVDEDPGPSPSLVGDVSVQARATEFVHRGLNAVGHVHACLWAATYAWEEGCASEVLPFPEGRLTPRPDGTLTRSYDEHADVVQVLLVHGLQLLVSWWPRLRRCAYGPCHALFRPRHGGQQFDDAGCASKARDTRFRERHNESDRQHEQYQIRRYGNTPVKAGRQGPRATKQLTRDARWLAEQRWVTQVDSIEDLFRDDVTDDSPLRVSVLVTATIRADLTVDAGTTGTA